MALALGALSLAAIPIGCVEPADLENAGSYAKPSGGGSASGGSGAGGSATGGGGSGTMGGCETPCLVAIIDAPGTGCKSCHGANVRLSGTLDFETPGYTARLKDQPAPHAGVADLSKCATTDKYIDSTAPANSWLLKKIRNQQDMCGTQMPLGGLPEPDQTCVETYVNCVASGAK